MTVFVKKRLPDFETSRDSSSGIGKDHDEFQDQGPEQFSTGATAQPLSKNPRGSKGIKHSWRRMRSIQHSAGRRLGHSDTLGQTFSSFLLLAFAACMLSVASSAQSTADEYQLKAAFLFHFTQFVEWPAEALGEDNSPFLICIVGEDPFQNSLEEAIQGKLVVGRPAKIRHIRQVEDGQKCHLIFLGNTESGRVSQLSESLKHGPVLTVGESADFLKKGGIIRFCMEGNKVRFEVSQEAAQGANLKISSRLLLLAKAVVVRKE